jgi:transcriptional regulator with XRE-family HTH domain
MPPSQQPTESAGELTEAERWFGVNLAAARDRKRMSQTALGKAMALRGFPFHQTTISRIEVGLRAVRVGEALALAQILGVTFEELTSQPDHVQLQERLRAVTAELAEALDTIRHATADAVAAGQALERELDKARAAGVHADLVQQAEQVLQRTPEGAVSDGWRLSESLTGEMHDDEDRAAASELDMWHADNDERA